MELGMEVGLGQATLCYMATQFPPPKQGHSPQFSAHVRCRQMAGWIKMPLSLEVGLGTGDFVLDGGPRSPKKGAHLPSFRPMSIVAKWLVHQNTTWYGGRPLSGDIVLDGEPAPPPQKAHSPQIFGPCLLWPSGRPSQLLLRSCSVCY